MPTGYPLLRFLRGFPMWLYVGQRHGRMFAIISMGFWVIYIAGDRVSIIYITKISNFLYARREPLSPRSGAWTRLLKPPTRTRV